MTEMIERVAAALFNQAEDDGYTNWEAMARAAIKAMSKPTEDMLRNNTDYCHGEVVESGAIFWRSMCDDALGDIAAFKKSDSTGGGHGKGRA